MIDSRFQISINMAVPGAKFSMMLLDVMYRFWFGSVTLCKTTRMLRIAYASPLAKAHL